MKTITVKSAGAKDLLCLKYSYVLHTYILGSYLLEHQSEQKGRKKKLAMRQKEQKLLLCKV